MKKLTFDNAPEMLSTPQAAELLNLHLNTVQGWIKTNKLPAVQIGRNWKVRKADLLKMTGTVTEAQRLRAALENVLEAATLADAQAIAAAALEVE